MRQTITLPQLSSGVSGGQATGGVTVSSTISLQPIMGFTYHRIVIDLLNATNYQYLTGLRVKINGDIYQQYSGWADLWNHNAYLKALDLTNDLRFLQIFFERPNLKDENQSTLTSLYTGQAKKDPQLAIDTGAQVQTFTIEMDWSIPPATEAVPGFTPVCYGIVSDDLLPPNIVTRRNYNTFSINNATGINDIQLQKGLPILFVELQQSVTNLGSVQLLRDNQIIFDRTAQLNAQIQKTENLRVPNTAYMYVIDSSENGEGDQPLVTTTLNGQPVSSMICRMNMLVAQSSIAVGTNVLDSVK